jgi:histidinol dehydrogenase
MFNCIQGMDALQEWLVDHQLTTSSIDTDTFNRVSKIQQRVMQDKDQALCDYTKELDQVALTPDQLRVSNDVIQAAYQQVDAAYVLALKKAADNIREYHLNQVPQAWEDKTQERMYGIQFSAIESVGLYVPGGRAVYPSSVLMTAIPAVIAGCERIVMVSPPTGGSIPASVLVAADMAGVTEIYSIGGAQAVFGLAYGTESIPSVDKIVGPGNKFVTAAKQLVYGVVDIDKPAGPSEVCVAIDTSEYAAYAASELLAQLEHDPDASAICIVSSQDIATRVCDHASQQFPQLKRQSILEQSKENGVVVVVDSTADMIDAINLCASEHLVLLSDTPHDIRAKVRHAGSIFCGPYTPVTLGDYYAGPNHVLPTARSARFASPLGVMDFMKYSSYLEYSKSALMHAQQDLEILTSAEGFDGHYQAVLVRTQSHG